MLAYFFIGVKAAMREEALGRWRYHLRYGLPVIAQCGQWSGSDECRSDEQDERTVNSHDGQSQARPSPGSADSCSQ
jgi:hypothetical protein